ncbi:hypothetical protein D3C72_1202760 [compost metagenome]
MALDAGKDAGHLVAERNRGGLLQVGPTDHRRVAVLLRQRRKRVSDVLEIRLDQCQALAHLQYRRCVGNVLGGGAPMAEFAKPIPAVRVDLVDHRDNRISDLFGLCLELNPVNLGKFAILDDLVGRFLRDDAKLTLHFCQCSLDVQVFSRAVFIGPHFAHARVAKHVAKNAGINDGGSHRLRLR